MLLNSLELVTYRGYDSFGVALLNGQGIQVSKEVGTVEERRHQVEDLQGTLGIAHTRWATVGSVSAVNAHPHQDCSGDLAVVHNGNIDNFLPLRQRLQSQGHEFRSETDSEVICHLIEAQGEGDIVEATRQAIQELEGSFAIAILHRPSRRLILARRENPLVIGLGEEETFVASDVPAILPYTNRMIYLEDDDLALVWAGGMQVWQNGAEATRPVLRVPWSAAQMSKGGFEHHMLKEIYEQPEAIRNTVAEIMPEPATEGTSSPIDFLPIRDPDAVLMLGCGTSYHAALMGEQILSHLITVPVTAVVASEFQKPAVEAERGLVVAFSQSGETSDTLTALRRIKGRGYASLGVTNVMGSSITRAVNATFYTQAGPEVAVASTKTFLCQLVTLYILGFLLAPNRDAVAVIPQELQALPGKVRQVLSQDSAIQQAVRELTRAEHIFIIAKGLGVPIALEGALKFKEVAYLPTEGYPAGELKHGPFALLGEKTPVIAMVLADEHRSRMITSIKEIKARGSTVIAIADRGDGEVAEFADMVLPVPKTDPLLAPVLHNVVLQLMSYYCARKLGCPIDRPRNLAKSVTVP